MWEDGAEAGGQFAAPHVDADGEHDDRADHDVLNGGRHRVEVEAVLHDHDGHRADDGVDDRAAPAGKAGPADHGSCDGGQLEPNAIVGGAGVQSWPPSAQRPARRRTRR